MHGKYVCLKTKTGYYASMTLIFFRTKNLVYVYVISAIGRCFLVH